MVNVPLLRQAQRDRTTISHVIASASEAIAQWIPASAEPAPCLTGGMTEKTPDVRLDVIPAQLVPAKAVSGDL